MSLFIWFTFFFVIWTVGFVCLQYFQNVQQNYSHLFATTVQTVLISLEKGSLYFTY